MPARVSPLEKAIIASQAAHAAASAINDLLTRYRAGETISNLHGDIDAATADMLAAAETIRSAVDEYQIVDRRITGGL